jgi:elongation factor G
MGELHLEIIVDRLFREWKVEANVGKPQVAYRETITRRWRSRASTSARPAATASTATSGCAWSRRARARASTSSTGRGGSVPKEYVPAVEKGVAEAGEAGVISGFPMVDVTVTLFDGSFHEVDSDEISFKIAASMAVREGAEKAAPMLLEPIMATEVVTPDQYMGEVMGDLNSRRGKILGMEPRSGAQVVDAQVPLASMFGYATDLRSLTQGRATYTMQFSHYQPVPSGLAEELLHRLRGY